MFASSFSVSSRRNLVRSVIIFVLALSAFSANAAPMLKVLFLGDNGHHQPAALLRSIGPVLMSRGIQLVYTEDLSALTLQNLKRYDALLIYANIDNISPEQDKALSDYVTQGGGLFPLHCASYCFRNSDRYVSMVGGQFKSHGTGVFKTTIVAPDNPIMQGFGGFESWDETYVHSHHNEQNRTVLERRADEPYTWVRTEGLGRVFYTAWGHDERTWSNPGFQELVERGLRFAAGQKLPGALVERPQMPGLELVGQNGIPYYPPGQRSRGDGSWPQMQKPLSPEQSMKHIVVPAGFELQLVAADPDIKKPIAMAWDERGRLWIAETLDYPNRLLAPGEAGRDRLVICEDTNNDGRMDKFTVFAEGLNIPTSFTFSNGGVILHQMPSTLFLKDTDGDGRADLREVLFTGWGRTDTHAGPNNLEYGLDNWIWGMVGYSGYDGSVAGDRLAFKQGFYRFRADGSKLEFLRATNNNTWGLGIREDGTVFGSTANNNPSVYLPIPNRYYTSAGLEPKTLGGIAETSRFFPLTGRVRQVDVHWGYTAAAGHAFYTARAYPKEYWNRTAFVTEPTGHLVGQFNVEASGADFRSKSPTNLVYSDDEWFAPIMAEVGPDGSVWVIDWYNYIVQHNPTPKGFENGKGNAYDNPLRDQRHGRIYRIVWKGDGAKPAPAPMSLANATPQQLVDTLKNDNLFWRRHAQRLLVERGRKDVVPALIALVRDQSVDEIGLNVSAVHALWTLHGLHAIDADPAALAAASSALRHPSAAVRRNALMVLPHTATTVASLLEAGALNDAEPQVRLAALLALADAPEVPEAAQALYTSLSAPDLKLDRWTVDAAKMAASAQRKLLTLATPADLAAAREVASTAVRVPTIVDNFEQSSAAQPADWSLAATTGQAEHTVVDGGYQNSNHSLRITASAGGADVRVIKKIKVKPGNAYQFRGAVKTEAVTPVAPAKGAFVSIVEIQKPKPVASMPMTGTADWSGFSLNFDTGDRTEITIAASLGGGGTTTGTAQFDELMLNDLGPSDQTIARPLAHVLAHLQEQTGRGTESAASDPNLAVLNLGVVPDVMKYDHSELTVTAGRKARLVFKNTDHMQHNAVVIRPGTIDKVGALADAMLSDPTALGKNYVPATGDVLFNTPLVNPGEAFSLDFVAPTEPGQYTIICTFPGHWRIMQATLVVTAAK
ncbi:MAG: PVC-type heme-binding CxxCH protein [Opitutus sp.]